MTLSQKREQESSQHLEPLSIKRTKYDVDDDDSNEKSAREVPQSDREGLDSVNNEEPDNVPLSEDSNDAETGNDKDISHEPPSLTKDLELNLKPQLDELDRRTEASLKRILRRRLMQSNLEETSDEEEEDGSEDDKNLPTDSEEVANLSDEETDI